MFSNIGLPELLMIGLLSLVVWGLPIVAAIWALVTLARVRRGQDAMMARLDQLETLLHTASGRP